MAAVGALCGGGGALCGGGGVALAIVGAGALTCWGAGFDGRLNDGMEGGGAAAVAIGCGVAA